MSRHSIRMDGIDPRLWRIARHVLRRITELKADDVEAPYYATALIARALRRVEGR